MSGLSARLAKVLVLAGLVFAATAASGAASRQARVPFLGIVPHTGATHATSLRALGLATSTGSGPLVLQTQPCTYTDRFNPCWVMATNKVYAIYWVPSGYSVGANYESLIDRYFADVAAASGSLTNVYSVAMQYYDDSEAVHYGSTFGGSYVDTRKFPANGCTATAVCLTDAQIQAEIQNVITANGWHAGPDAMFFLMTPKGVGSCFDGTNSECTTNAYCAYHSGFPGSNGDPVVYANMPYAAGIGGCGSGSSPNGGDADATINTISHEHNEAITDPWGNAWLSNDTNHDEIGDLCAWDFGATLGRTASGQQYNQLINGHPYWLQQEYSNDGDACLQSYTPTTAPVTVAPPVVSGSAGDGQLLSTSDGSWMNAPNGYAYQWQRCAADGTGCVDIPGAAAAAYRLTAADRGSRVRSEVRADNVAGTAAAYVPSAPTPVVVALPSLTAAPVLAGVAAVGKQLSTSNGSWTTTATFTYRWLRCTAFGTRCKAIAHATSATYRAGHRDAGHTLEARVSATNAAGTRAAFSNRSSVVIGAPVSIKPPRISGHARVGRRLSASTGRWSGPPTAYRFEWFRCNARGGSCVRIRHATHSTYRIAQRDGRHRLRVRVTAIDAAGRRSARSASTAVVTR
jgi:hypothetical protein